MKKLFSEKYLTYFFVVIFILTLIPLSYLSFINRATGDDYWYGHYTRIAWQSSHSLIAIIKASFDTIKQFYYSWQGTWFTIFLFTLQPEVFSDKAYFITAFLMLFLWIGSTFLIFRELLVVKIGMDKWSYRLFTIIFLMVSIQFIPSTRSAIFWFNGGAHYMIPFAMCQFLAYALLHFSQKYSLKWYIIICILMTLLGGANYQAAILGLIITFYLGIAAFLNHNNKRIFALFFPIALEITGLIISMRAPGNKVRGGEDFGFSLAKGFLTIGLSFIEGIRDIGDYINNSSLIFIGLILIFLISLNAFRKNEYQIINHPVIASLALFCLYSSMQAPAIYAGVEVSGGVYNMNYQMFLLTASGILLIISQCIAVKYHDFISKFYGKIIFLGMALCMIIFVLGRSDLKTSTLWVSMEYIISGQAADYREQMNLQTDMLVDENVTDVILPQINNIQGPLMHMPVTSNPDAWTNTVTSNFYGKNSVVAIPRPEWEALYLKLDSEH